MGAKISAVRTQVSAGLQEVEALKMSLGEMDIGSKIQQHLMLNRQHKDALAASLGDIKLMTQQLNELAQYASDDEEQDNIKNIKEALNKLSEKS